MGGIGGSGLRRRSADRSAAILSRLPPANQPQLGGLEYCSCKEHCRLRFRIAVPMATAHGRTNRELPRRVRRLASPDQSQPHGPQPAERRRYWRSAVSALTDVQWASGARGGGVGRLRRKPTERPQRPRRKPAERRRRSLGLRRRSRWSRSSDSDGRSPHECRWAGTSCRAASLACVHEGPSHGGARLE